MFSVMPHHVLIVGAGQSGLAAAYAALEQGLRPVLLEASDRAAGSWPRYYDSLTLFSPARYSALPGLPFDGDPERYPHRDEVVAYLTRYADWKSTRLNSSHVKISYAVFCLKKKNTYFIYK